MMPNKVLLNNTHIFRYWLKVLMSSKYPHSLCCSALRQLCSMQPPRRTLSVTMSQTLRTRGVRVPGPGAQSKTTALRARHPAKGVICRTSCSLPGAHRDVLVPGWIVLGTPVDQAVEEVRHDGTEPPGMILHPPVTTVQFWSILQWSMVLNSLDQDCGWKGSIKIMMTHFQREIMALLE